MRARHPRAPAPAALSDLRTTPPRPARPVALLGPADCGRKTGAASATLRMATATAEGASTQTMTSILRSNRRSAALSCVRACVRACPCAHAWDARARDQRRLGPRDPAAASSLRRTPRRKIPAIQSPSSRPLSPPCSRLRWEGSTSLLLMTRARVFASEHLPVYARRVCCALPPRPPAHVRRLQ